MLADMLTTIWRDVSETQRDDWYCLYAIIIIKQVGRSVGA